MKLFLTIALVIVSTLILILFFQNLWGTLDGVGFLFHQFDQQSSAGLGLLIFMGVGFIAGLLAASLVYAILTEGEVEKGGGEGW